MSWPKDCALFELPITWIYTCRIMQTKNFFEFSLGRIELEIAVGGAGNSAVFLAAPVVLCSIRYVLVCLVIDVSSVISRQAFVK